MVLCGEMDRMESEPDCENCFLGGTAPAMVQILALHQLRCGAPPARDELDHVEHPSAMLGQADNS